VKIKIYVKINISNKINTLDLFSGLEAEKNQNLAKKGTALKKITSENENLRVVF